LKNGSALYARIEFRGAARRDGDAGVVAEIAALEQRQAQTLQQIDEHDGAVFERLADDALGRQAKTLRQA
jgi:hypothetical protein